MLLIQKGLRVAAVGKIDRVAVRRCFVSVLSSFFPPPPKGAVGDIFAAGSKGCTNVIIRGRIPF